MRTVYFFLFFTCFTVTASAQKVYFIYLETEKINPFYVKIGDQVHSSGSGYLTLSNLVDSTYTFSIGYPSSKTESKFIVSLVSKDKGFLIKNFDYGLGLFDMQTLSVVKPQVDESQKNISYRARNDDFTTLLAKASNDSSLLLVPILAKQDVVIQKEEKKEETLPKNEEVISKTDTVITTPPQTDLTGEIKKQEKDPPPMGNKEEKKETTDSVSLVKKDVIDSSALDKQSVQNTKADSTALNAEIVRKDTSSLVAESPAKEATSTSEQSESYKRSTVKKYAESSTSEGFGLVFHDIHEGGADTIRLLIPNPKIILKQPDAIEINEEKLSEIGKDTTTQKIIVAPVKGSGIIVKSHCKSVASDNDFFKLRKNMAGKTSDDSMVGEAKKIFKSKCFTTEQIRNLGSLFLTSAGKYQFFDAAYLHVTDRENYASLESDIRDEYYLKRFKALVGE